MGKDSTQYHLAILKYKSYAIERQQRTLQNYYKLFFQNLSLCVFVCKVVAKKPNMTSQRNLHGNTQTNVEKSNIDGCTHVLDPSIGCSVNNMV